MKTAEKIVQFRYERNKRRDYLEGLVGLIGRSYVGQDAIENGARKIGVICFTTKPYLRQFELGGFPTV
jgi:hypothetical protein